MIKPHHDIVYDIFAISLTGGHFNVTFFFSNLDILFLKSTGLK